MSLTSIVNGALGVDVRTILNTLVTAFNNKSGFIDYNNTSGPITLAADTWTDIPNDGLGAFSNDLFPPNVTKLMDPDGTFNFSELALGDDVLIRNDYTVTPTVNNSLLQLRYQIGVDQNEYILETDVGRLDVGSGKGYRYSLKPDYIYMGDSNTKDNPITLQLKLSSAGVVTNAGSAIKASRR